MYTPTEAQREAILSYLAEHFDEAKADLKTLIRIPSVKAAPAGDAPFGAPMQACLDAALSIGRRLGFTTTDLDGYVGLCDGGAGDEMLGVLCHLDVVPAGEGWSGDPFGGEERGGRICGRGTTDDKGPAVCALYALAAVEAAGIPFKRRVRVLLGCDEESGWDCIARYKKTEPIPAMSFSPDGEYPLVFAERTILQATFSCAKPSRLRIASGERANVVPGTATAWVPFPVENCPEADGITVTCTPEKGGTFIKVEGVGAHASTPHVGKSALLHLLRVLRELPLSEGDGREEIRLLGELLLPGHHGEGFGLDAQDGSGRLTLSPGILRWDEQSLTLTLDLRIPLSHSPDAALETLSAAMAKAGLSLKKTHVQPGHHIPLTSELTKTLLHVFRAEGGDPAAEPLAIGGGTYARAFPNAVAFGCETPGSPMRAHMPDEYITLDEMAFHMRVMAFAIAALAGA